MIFSFLKRRRRSEAIEPLYGAMMAKALAPALFAEYSVPDTFEGRFESVTLHAALVLRRLAALPKPADDVAQDLVDRTFDGIDSAMREVGISDVGVPKRMKKFADGFYGRLAAYTAALAPEAAPEALAAALARNVLGADADAAPFAAHVRRLAAALDGLTLDDLARGALDRTTPQERT